MSFNSVTPSHIDALRAIVGDAYISIDTESLVNYGHDETEDFNFPPEVVVKPATTDEVSQIMKLCFDAHLPVTPRGAGTGLSGGALPIHKGICLSSERMNQIVAIDEDNLQIITQPGVITEVLQNAVQEKGLFYPPDPASKGSCFIGGNIAENSGGPKAVKYGVVKDYVLNLELVLPNGEVIWTGANVLKNATGYNLTQLVVGSEGTLGVVTQIVLRLIPYPKHNLLMLAPFTSAEKACEAVSAIFKAGITPSGLEFMERDAIDCSLQMVDDVQLPIDASVQAHLLIEVDGNDMNVLMNECEQIGTLLNDFGVQEILFADDEAQKDNLWKLRRRVGEAVKSRSIYKEEDTVVPRAALPQLLNGVKTIGNQYGFQSVCYGHAGDGNLHVNILKGELTDHQWDTELPLAIREIFELVKELGGTISGEHGIGFVQRDYMSIIFDETTLNLMKSIKKVFDPKGIMNPGKIFN